MKVLIEKDQFPQGREFCLQTGFGLELLFSEFPACLEDFILSNFHNVSHLLKIYMYSSIYVSIHPITSVSLGILTNRVFVLCREKKAEKKWRMMREGETAGAEALRW